MSVNRVVKQIQEQNDDALASLMKEIGIKAKKASIVIANADSEAKNIALRKAAIRLRDDVETILGANAKDMEQGKVNGLDKALLDRLLLTPQRINAMAQGLEDIASLNDPVGRVLDAWDRPNGLKIKRVSVPLGVIGIIYESRPNVTADAAALCIKSGNAAILRGGSDSLHSALAIAEALYFGLEEAGLPKDIIQVVPTNDREAVGKMLKMVDYIDVIVPRGGKGLCKRVQDESRIPTFQHLDGNCHTYIHYNASPAMAKDVILNAKLRRTGICGATESIVVDEEAVPTILPEIIQSLLDESCEIRGDEKVRALNPEIKEASEHDWDTEYLDSIVSIKSVPSLEEAITFVNAHSSHHTDAIITDDLSAAELFCKKIDSAIVMHNTSTQFADGGEFGMGAEIGISTGKLHARGPVGVDQLNTFKYIVEGDGQIRPKG